RKGAQASRLFLRLKFTGETPVPPSNKNSSPASSPSTTSARRKKSAASSAGCARLSGTQRAHDDPTRTHRHRSKFSPIQNQQSTIINSSLSWPASLPGSFRSWFSIPVAAGLSGQRGGARFAPSRVLRRKVDSQKQSTGSSKIIARWYRGGEDGRPRHAAHGL